MKHIDEITIQKYIDNELSPEERSMVEMHLTECKKCGEYIENQRVFVDIIKKSLDGFVPQNDFIPEFHITPRQTKSRTLRIALISSITTACAILLTFFIIKGFQKPEPKDNFEIYDFITIEEYDANKPMTEQLFTYIENNI